MGNRKWLMEMAWSNQTQFVAAPERNWTVGGKLAGSVQAHGPLSFVKVRRRTLPHRAWYRAATPPGAACAAFGTRRAQSRLS